MSQTTKSSTWKCCGTCQYWSGPREPDTFMKNVKYDTISKSKCLGMWKGIIKGGDDTCTSWAKWGVLK
jgi:hypothetical protein